jgi:histidinol-phosphate aminotransferase
MDIEAIASSEKYSGLVIVDEAYIDFSTPGQSAVALLEKYPNVVILQTLSKAFGLAGIRCGFCFGAPDVIQLMNNVKAPYNVNAMTSEVAINALKSTDILEKHVNETLEQRAIVKQKLEGLTNIVVKVYPSDANFLLFRVRDKAFELYRTMAENGVVTRFRGNELHCEECIRVTIGTPEQNNVFLDLLQRTWRDLSG